LREEERVLVVCSDGRLPILQSIVVAHRSVILHSCQLIGNIFETRMRGERGVVVGGKLISNNYIFCFECLSKFLRRPLETGSQLVGD
jgi:hypothetical protein